MITVPKYLSAGNCSAFQKSPHLKGNPRQFSLGDSRYCIPDSLSVELGFRISIVNGIPVSLSCIPDSKQNIPGFRIPRAKISRISESGFSYMGRQGILSFGKSNNTKKGS